MNEAIICVDDDKLILASLKFQLKKHFQEDYVLEFAESVPEAIELTEELIEYGIKVLAIVSDYLIPKIDGEQLVRLMKVKYPNIKIIMLTGQANSNVIKDLLQEDLIEEVVDKPWAEAHLINTIKNSI